MKETFLLEIGLEEVPARFIPGALKQLQEKVTNWLEEQRLPYEKIEMYSTPRRFAVRIEGLGEKQPDIREEVKGPAKRIAVDEAGNWTKAAQGFARSQGVSEDELFFRELNGVEYVYAVKESEGRAAADVLKEELAGLISGLNFPKNMRWADLDLRFVRPIRWIVALLGSQIIPIELAGVSSGRKTYGHRFLGSELELNDARHYVEQLREQFVIVDVEERKNMIVDQLRSLAAEKGWEIPMNPDLLEEVIHLVEYPTALAGGFDEQFLEIPEDVLITSMREHQRYFPVNDPQTGKLMPYFVTVRNGDSRSLETVAKGNEKVLRARLADARFFYTEDQKLPIDEAMNKLESVVFHEELGTVGDKVRRIVKIAGEIANKLQLDSKLSADIQRTASICKFDLVTQMVYEFPELQGIMGEDYALKAGEKPEVAKSISEHYKPRFAGDSAPGSLTAAVVSIADKMDTIAGCFSIGIIPTGSQDPYALRRQAAGIVQTIHEHDLDLPLDVLFQVAIDVLAESNRLKKGEEQIVQELFDFFALRVKSMLQDLASYDVVDAVMAAGFKQISSAVRRTKALKNFISQPDHQSIIEAFNRVDNLAAKASGAGTIQTELFEDAVESELYDAWKKQHQSYVQWMNEGQEASALNAISELTDTIHRYFDHVMVMADDEKVRENRLALLAGISTDIGQFADFHKIVRS